MKWVIILVCFLNLGFSQEKVNLYGYIKNEENLPVEYSSIYLEDLNIKTTSDINGFFKFENIKNTVHHFHIESYDYSFFCRKISLHSDTTIYITIKSKTNILDEIMLEDHNTNIKQKKSVSSVSFISRESIKASKYFSITDIITDLPGIRKMNTGVSISKPIIRGMSGDRVSVYDIGIKQEDQQWGNDHGLQISKYDADKIQVHRGSSTLMYSGANGGAIDISPDTYIQNEGETFEGNISSNYKTNNNSFDISNQTKFNFENSLIDIRLNYQKYSDYQIPSKEFSYNGYVFPIENNRLKNTAGEDNGISLIYKRVYENGFFLIKISNINQKNGIFAGAVGIPTISNTSQDGNYANISLPYQHSNHFKSIFYFKNILFGNWVENSFGLQNNTREEFTIPSNHGRKVKRLDNLGLSLSLLTLSNNIKYSILSENKNLYIGLYSQFQNNKIDGFEYLIPKYKDFFFEFYNVFRQEIEDEFSYELGAKIGYKMIHSERFEAVYEFSNKGDYKLEVENLEKKYFGYSFSGGVSYFPNDELSYKFNASLLYKFPIIPELASNGIHHGTFRHEKGYQNLNIEQGITLESEFYFSREILALKLTPFYSYYWNYIFLSPSLEFSPLPEGGQIYQYRQVPAYFFGIEFNTIINLYKDLLSLNIKGDYIYSINRENDYSLPFTPPFYLKIVMDYTPKIFDSKLNIKLSQDFCATQNMVAINEKTTQGYSTTNISVAKNLVIKNKTSFDFSFDIINIFNTKYFGHLSRYRILDIPEQGRNILFGINYNF